MYPNRLYNTRNSGRFNASAQFVAATEQQQQQPQQTFQGTPKKQPQPPPPPAPKSEDEDMDVKPATEMDEDMSTKQEERPAWMKSKLSGVKKISNKERRRRQNETLRRLLTPKNALMVLNEMVPHEQIANQFKLEVSPNQFYSKSSHSFCVDLSVEGSNYKGYGDNKLSARNAAAEQAIRDLIIKKMNKVVAAAAATDGSQNGDEASGASEEEAALPMIQLASFALHKLFTEWECNGHKVPQLRPSGGSVSEPAAASAATSAAASTATAATAKSEAGDAAPVSPGAAAAAPRARKPRGPKKPHVLPLNASAMHPCMLLAYMRPRLDYRELAVEGDRPQNMMFTMGVDVDGATYVGKAMNKKEARKAAARAACAAIFGTRFDDGAAATTPRHA